jgi:HEPN domain-containing protein
MSEPGGSPEGRDKFLLREADARLKEAKTLRDHEHYEAACGRSWTSATYGLTGFLHRTGAGVSADCDDLLRLGVQVRKRAGAPPPPEFQEAIWRLSAYREEPLPERVAPRGYDEADAKNAFDAAELVLKQVGKWIGQAKQGSQDPAAP